MFPLQSGITCFFVKLQFFELRKLDSLYRSKKEMDLLFISRCPYFDKSRLFLTIFAGHEDASIEITPLKQRFHGIYLQ